MTKLIHLFLKNRDAFAIGMLLAGGSLNYALRDGLGLAPNNAAFSFLFIFGWIFMVLPFRDFNKVYFKRNPLVIPAVLYLTMTMIYMYIYADPYKAPLSVKLYDVIVLFIVWYFLFYLSFVKEDNLGVNFLNITIWIAFLGSMGLIIFVLMNPNYILGQRLAISFGGDSEGDAMGNPHIYARTAVFGILSGLMFLKHNKNKRNNIFLIICLVICYAVLILSQAMSAILGGMLMSAFFFFNNVTFKAFWKSVKRLFSKWYVWVIMVLLVVKGMSFIRQNEVIIELGYRVIERRVVNLLNTFTTEKDEGLYVTEEVKVDDSASTRVKNIAYVKETLAENFEEGKFQNLIFGNGYFDLYVDVPVMEVFNSYGLLGLTIFGIFFFLMTRYCIAEMKNPSGIFSEFVAYGYLYFFVYTFTNGLIMDYNRWTYFILVVRFIPGLTQKLRPNPAR